MVAHKHWEKHIDITKKAMCSINMMVFYLCDGADKSCLKGLNENMLSLSYEVLQSTGETVQVVNDSKGAVGFRVGGGISHLQ